MNGGLKSCATCEYPKMSDFQKREVLPSKTPNKKYDATIQSSPKTIPKKTWNTSDNLQDTSLKLVVVVFPIAFLTAQPALSKVRESPAKVVGLHLAKLVGGFQKKKHQQNSEKILPSPKLTKFAPTRGHTFPKGSSFLTIHLQGAIFFCFREGNLLNP